MRISKSAGTLLAGALIALIVAFVSQLAERKVKSDLGAWETDPTLRTLGNECKRTGDWYGAVAKHYGVTTADGTPVETDANCNSFVRAWDEMEPHSESSSIEFDQSKMWVRTAADWGLPVAAFVFAFSSLPWLWHFILRRIRELRNAIAGK